MVRTSVAATGLRLSYSVLTSDHPNLREDLPRDTALDAEHPGGT